MKKESIRNWHSDLEEITAKFVSQFGHLSPEALNYKMSASSWNIIQIVTHVMLVNESYFPVFDTILNKEYKEPRLGKLNFLKSFFSGIILKSVAATNPKKVQTFGIWEPKDVSAEAAIPNFQRHQNKLRDYILQLVASGYLETTIRSPANPYIIYSLESAIEIIIEHEKRHLRQAEEILKTYSVN